MADNDKRTQSLELGGSVTWQAKSAVMTASLADALQGNTKLTALNLSGCNVGDSACGKLADAIAFNSTLFELDLSDNKLGRPGLVALAKALATNTGLIQLDLTGHRINSDVRRRAYDRGLAVVRARHLDRRVAAARPQVCAAYVEMFSTNMTLCKLIWKLEVAGYNLKFTELTNRNTEIDRCVRDAADYVPLLPEAMQATRRCPA